jgi:hypothetical protein
MLVSGQQWQRKKYERSDIQVCGMVMLAIALVIIINKEIKCKAMESAVSVMAIISTLALAINGFFLAKFYDSVEKVRKGQEELKVLMARRDESINTIENDVHEIKNRQQVFDDRLREIEIAIAKIK